MDAANLRQQDQLPGSSLGTSSFHEVSNNHLWNQIFMLNGENSSDSSTPTLKMFQPGFNGVISSSRGLIQTSPTLGYNINSSSINQDVGFNWSPSNSQSYTNHSNQELQFAKIKQELSDSFPNYSGTVSDPSIFEGLFLAASAGYIKNEQDLQELNEKLSLKSSSNLHGSCGDVYNNNTHQSSANFGGVATCSSSSNWRGQDLNSMNMQALDLLDSAKFGGILSNPNQNNLSLIREHGCFGLNLQEQNHRPYNNQQKMPTFINEAPEAKRCSSSTEPKTFETTHKKPRYDHTSSFPPFKVRKEKLGDRITALQQLVAPFGKTDTASVLLEAIGYIKFLQDQVETLSVPYMKASGDSSSRTQGASLKGSSSIEENKERNEPTRDLRSRGLCLVPLSCTSHVTDDIVGAVWPPSNFGGGI